MVFGFVIVGNFEDVIYVWCNYMCQWFDLNDGVLLVVGSGVFGVCFVGLFVELLSFDVLVVGDSGLLMVGDDCMLCMLQLVVGFVWCVVILWMILLLMLMFVVWVL